MAGVLPDPIVREVYVDATPETVFGFFTDSAKLARWLATEATLDPRPGGICHQVHAGGIDLEPGRYEMRGEFVEVTRPGRVVFTWGFLDPEIGVPPGSSVVEVSLTPEGQGPRVRLVHRALPDSALDSHTRGWTTMLDRLARAVTTTQLEAR